MVSAAYEGFALVEIMGHVRLAGLVSEVQQYGATMIRVDIPEVPGVAGGPALPGFTRFYGGSVIYSVTPCEEAIAVAFTRRDRPEPVQRYDLALLPAVAPPDAETIEDDEDVCPNCDRPSCVCDDDERTGPP